LKRWGNSRGLRQQTDLKNGWMVGRLGGDEQRRDTRVNAPDSYRAGVIGGQHVQKASSLARVERRVDDPSVSPVNLAALAETF
jgi:hypothetical protein